MANWRRERNGGPVHVVTDDVPVALCGLDRRDAPISLWEPREAVRDLCAACADRIRKQTELVDSTLALVLAKLDRVAEDEYARIYEAAKSELRELARIVPAGQIADQLTYARACLVRNDPSEARAFVRSWRAALGALGPVVPTAD